jgi:3-hydroxyisobutyrate dehydrogenase-like beta-hydroxyacid dehydrogenase
MARIAVVGLGGMGSRIAARLLDAGHELTVWNRTAAKAEPLVERGARAAATPRDAVEGAEFALTMVADPDALAAVTEGPDGVVAGLRPGAVYLEMSTVGPQAVARLAEAVPAGVDLLDAPVLGSHDEAEAGQLTIFVGGSDEGYERARSILGILGKPLHVGSHSHGAAAKLVANSTLFAVIGAFGEALALADGLGLSREAAWQVLASTPVGPQVERRRPAVESGEYPPRFPLSLALKDARLVEEAAAEAGVELKLAHAAREWLERAVVARGSLDYSAVLAEILGEAVDSDTEGTRRSDGSADR